MSKSKHEKVLGKKDITLFCISAILLLDTLAAGAAIGTSSIFWWIFLGIVFFIPFSLMTAELGCAYPDQGGIYAWVKRAYGEIWASRITWSYWVNVAIWCPALFILFAGIFKQMFWPGMTLPMQIGVGVLLAWLTVLINFVTLDIGKWVPNLGAIIKLLVFAVIIGGAVNYSSNHSFANEISLSSIAPNFDDGIEYITVIIYGLLGFELVSAGSDEIRNPRKNVPLGIFISGAIIITLYTAATFAILTAIPAQDINLVEGLVDTLTLFVGGSSIGNMIVVVLSIGALFTFFSNGVTWSLGANRAMAEAAIDGDMPAFLAIESRRGTPIGAALAFGVICTIILILYGLLAGSNEDLFWSLFAFSGVMFLIPYVLMAFTFIKLRKMDIDIERPFKVGGPKWFVNAMAYLCAVILSLTIVLFVYVPSDGVQWPVLLGSVFVLIFGEVLIFQSLQSKKTQG